MIASIVDVHDLLEVVWTGAVAGLGTTTAYGLAILGVGRALDYGRAGRPLEAVAYGVLGAAGRCGGGRGRGVRHRRDDQVGSPVLAGPRLATSRSSSSSLFHAPTEART